VARRSDVESEGTLESSVTCGAGGEGHFSTKRNSGPAAVLSGVEKKGKPMAETSEQLYCSEQCKKVKVVRSFGTCPECNMIWDGQNRAESRHYRNNAWKICDTCSRQQRRWT